MMETTVGKWEAFGDVNYEEHGGVWVRKVYDIGRCFDVVTWQP